MKRGRIVSRLFGFILTVAMGLPSLVFGATEYEVARSRYLAVVGETSPLKTHRGAYELECFSSTEWWNLRNEGPQLMVADPHDFGGIARSAESNSEGQSANFFNFYKRSDATPIALVLKAHLNSDFFQSIFSKVSPARLQAGGSGEWVNLQPDRDFGVDRFQMSLKFLGDQIYEKITVLSTSDEIYCLGRRVADFIKPGLALELDSTRKTLKMIFDVAWAQGHSMVRVTGASGFLLYEGAVTRETLNLDLSEAPGDVYSVEVRSEYFQWSEKNWFVISR